MVHRVKRLKDARTEAAKDIAELQARKTAELAEIQKQHTDQSALEAKIQQETEQRLEAVREQFEKNKAEAITKLVEAVSTVEA
ncbi:hypothetical protein FBU59_000564 [Linderina macrospora]|uniref:Uncharacterized protein n=1 Tax=Linderina macrospora TaxID=4868 RepID=A0ACC1JGG0_9FUNG|nr:hypothetical protein FBU59_000564 [Linderina macrospora]